MNLAHDLAWLRAGLALVLASTLGTAAADPLPSWRDGKSKQAIMEFVARVTLPGSPDFVPEPERIATFDNDGTLWAEQPAYFQLLFALDRVKTLAPQHPEWKTHEPFASLLKGDLKSALAGGEKAIVEILMATHAGMTSAEFEQIVTDWIATATHPTTGRPITGMVYQPMLALHAGPSGSTAFRRNRSSAPASSPRSSCAGTSRCWFASRSWTSSTINPASLSAFSRTSGVARSPPSATPMATCRCCSGPASPKARASASTSATMMPIASGRTTASRTSASSTKVWTRPRRTAGPSSA